MTADYKVTGLTSFVYANMEKLYDTTAKAEYKISSIEKFMMDNIHEFIGILSITLTIFFLFITLKILKNKFKIEHKFINILFKYINMGATSPLMLFLFGHLVLSIIITLHLVPSQYIHYIDKLQFIIITFASTWIVIKTISAADYYAKDNHIFTQLNLSKLLLIIKIVAIIISILFILNRLGINISALLTFGGVGGLVIGVAARDLFSNIMGALFVASGEVFKIGDQISIVDKNLYGIVKSITWRFTIIMDYDKKPLYVPNSFFTLYTIQNISQMEYRRINEVLTIEFNEHDTLNNLLEELNNHIGNSPITDDHTSPILALRGLGYNCKTNSNCAEINLRVFTKSIAYNAFQRDRIILYTEMLKIIEKFQCRIILMDSTEVYNKALITSK
ncbi:MAG: mechanosensitive ion channel family protein [Anaplasmataceae bacterium]|nr:mechanosensitive ion channel family protein [Anaplasmataceae bacterium]